MNTDYYYHDNEHNETLKKPAGKIEKSLKRLLIIAAVIFTAQLIWLFGVSPFIPFSTIEVNGTTDIARSDILALSGIDETSSFI